MKYILIAFLFLSGCAVSPYGYQSYYTRPVVSYNYGYNPYYNQPNFGYSPYYYENIGHRGRHHHDD